MQSIASIPLCSEPVVVSERNKLTQLKARASLGRVFTSGDQEIESAGWVILREAVGLVTVGSLFGLALAVGRIQFIRSQLHGVGPHDPLTLGVGTLLLLGVALVAVWPPMRRATSIDPVDALRVE